MNNFLTELVPLKLTKLVSSWMRCHLHSLNSIAVEIVTHHPNKVVFNSQC